MDTRSTAGTIAVALRPAGCGTDADLLRRCAGGEARAFDLFFRRHRDRLQGFLYLRLGSREEAEDALLAAFCNAWRARATYRGGATGKAWLYQIASRVALDRLRRRRRRPEPEALSEPFEAEAADVAALALQRESRREASRRLEAALGELRAEERRLVELFYFEERSYAEISSLLGVSRGQVRGRLHRVRGRLRERLAPQCGSGPGELSPIA